MSSYTVALTICLLFIAAHASSPLHIWSNTKYFNGQHIQIAEMASSSDAESVFKGEGSLGKYLEAGRPQPEAIVVFLEPERIQASLGTPSGVVGSNLKEILENGASSVSVQVAVPAGTKIVMNLVQNLQDGATVTLAKSQNCPLLSGLSGKADIRSMTPEELKLIAATKWDVLSNGVTDVVIVCLDSPALVEADAAQNSNAVYINTLLKSMGSSYLAVFSAAQPVVAELESPLVSEENDQVSQDGEWGSELIQAVIVMIPFVGILLTGICCTFSVQSELKFDLEKKKR